jgi:DNA-directed RNA polymerase specialized sigma24 family protein
MHSKGVTMARIEWVKQRLDNWARWKSREQGNGLGFYRQSPFLRMAVDCGGFREAQIPVDDVEARGTDEAVQSLMGDHPDLHRTLVLIYLEDAGIRLAAIKLACAESSVKARLERADGRVATFLRMKAQSEQAKREASKKTATP